MSTPLDMKVRRGRGRVKGIQDWWKEHTAIDPSLFFIHSLINVKASLSWIIEAVMPQMMVIPRMGREKTTQAWLKQSIYSSLTHFHIHSAFLFVDFIQLHKIHESIKNSKDWPLIFWPFLMLIKSHPKFVVKMCRSTEGVNISVLTNVKLSSS